MTALMTVAVPIPALARRYADIRAATMQLVAPLSEADCQVQSMADASPAKWHLAHTTWFFETFCLERFEPHFQTRFLPYHPAFRVLFNSYYQGVGAQHARPQRGLITRPSLADPHRPAAPAFLQPALARLSPAVAAGQRGARALAVGAVRRRPGADRARRGSR